MSVFYSFVDNIYLTVIIDISMFTFAYLYMLALDRIPIILAFQIRFEVLKMNRYWLLFCEIPAIIYIYLVGKYASPVRCCRIA